MPLSADRKPERRLANWISGQEQVWISLRHSKLPRALIDVVAARYGKRVVWQCTDQTDQLLLIAPPGYRLVVPLPAPTGMRRIRPVFAVWGFAALFAVLGIASAGVNTSLGNELAGNISLAIAFMLPLPILRALRLLPRSARVSLLAREFNGANGVGIVLSLYGLSDPLVAQLASTHGYFYMKQSRTRAQGRIITFVKGTH